MKQDFITKYFNLLIYRLAFYTNSFVDEYSFGEYSFSNDGKTFTINNAPAGLYTCIFKRVISPSKVAGNTINFNMPTDWRANDLYFKSNDKNRK